MVFEAPDGPLGLILAASWANLGSQEGSKMGVKSGPERHQKHDFKSIIKSNKKSDLVQFVFLFGAVLVTLFGTLFELQNWSKNC